MSIPELQNPTTARGQAAMQAARSLVAAALPDSRDVANFEGGEMLRELARGIRFVILWRDGAETEKNERLIADLERAADAFDEIEP